MAELRKTEESRYEVVVEGKTIGQVWNWHGSWSAQSDGKAYHGYKSRKQAVERVKRIHQLTKYAVREGRSCKDEGNHFPRRA